MEESPHAFFIRHAGQEIGKMEETTRESKTRGREGGEITMSTGVARAWVPRRKSAHVPLAAASFFSDRFNDRYRGGMIDAPHGS